MKAVVRQAEDRFETKLVRISKGIGRSGKKSSGCRKEYREER